MKMLSCFPSKRLHRFLGVGPLQHQASAVEMGAVAEGSEGFLEGNEQTLYIHWSLRQQNKMLRLYNT